MARSTDPAAPADPPASPDAPTRAQVRYDAWSSPILYFAALAWFVGFVFQVDPLLRPSYAYEGLILNLVVVGIFALDLVILLILDPHRATFLRRRWFLIVALIVPPLRIIFVVAAVRRISRSRSSLAQQVGLYALYGVLLVVFIGSLVTLVFEVRNPDSNITSYGDAVWWGFTTVTTVGYGDFTPITESGRTVAVLIMFSGAAVVGTLTAALASRFSAARRETADAEADSSTVIADLNAKIDVLQAQLETIAGHLGVPRADPEQRPATRPGGGE